MESAMKLLRRVFGNSEDSFDGGRRAHVTRSDDFEPPVPETPPAPESAEIQEAPSPEVVAAEAPKPAPAAPAEPPKPRPRPDAASARSRAKDGSAETGHALGHEKQRRHAARQQRRRMLRDGLARPDDR